ncbi:flagellar hook protein FlgE [Allochromatium warmingii]|uniref:Flagellar hook protein FlgE n=1 Tax=Allochromatium warmingii TaxID=61595 RepID=A0A1H3CMW5_ALLWA|nr:flagellar hook-basal body complex protein [Allochromatium warmingii]SDX55455.1 flagellar hook protein FlgE [Allochromatium warmingii]
MSFNIGLSGLYAAQKDLAVTGNNIANSATTGYKESRAEFANVYGQFRGCIASSGTGVRVASVAQQFHQGTIEQTKSSLDLAISGEGFFAVEDDGNLAYGRDGSFRVDNEGYIVTNAGARLLGYPRADNSDGYAYNPDDLEKVDPDLEVGEANPVFNKELSGLKLEFSGLQPKASSVVYSDVNLSSEAELILVPSPSGANEVPTFDPNDSSTYSYKKTFTAPDDQTTPVNREVTAYYVKTGETGGPPTTDSTWNIYYTIKGSTGTPLSQGPVAGTSVNATGVLTATPADLNFTVVNGTPTVTIPLAGLAINQAVTGNAPTTAEIQNAAIVEIPEMVHAPFDENDPDTYSYSTTITLYDSLGAARNVTAYYRRAENTNNAAPPESDPGVWEVYFQMEGQVDATGPKGPVFLAFDTNGNLKAVADDKTELSNGENLINSNPLASLVELKFDLTRYAPLNGGTIGPIDADTGLGTGEIKFDLSNLTQFGANYSINDLTQDGYTTGNLIDFGVNEEGVLSARYTNGQQRALGQIPLTSFKNPQGLKQVGDNLWVQTQASGEPVTDIPGSGRLGTIQSCSLESSNVDLATELVDLIKAQRSYQANAKTISAADEITQTVINMR